jgi:hypothetical protein
MSQIQVKRSRGEADRLVEEFEASGLSRREWARQAGVSVNTLDFYRKQRGRVGTRKTPWQAAASEASREAEGSRQAASDGEARPAEPEVGSGEGNLEQGQPVAGKQSRTPAKARPAAAPRWIEVRAEARPAPGGTGLRLLSPGGWRVEVEADFDAATLRRLLQVLGTAAREEG